MRGPRVLAVLRSLGGRVLTAVGVVVVVAALGALVVVPRAVGGAALTVLTGSMSPTIPAGSVVVVEPVDPRTVRVGDVVTYQVRPGEATYITHRVTAVAHASGGLVFTTQGDANDGPDADPVPQGAVRGRVLYSVPVVGRVRELARTPGPAAVAAGALLGVYALVQAVGSRRARRPGRVPEARRTTSRELLLATVPTAGLDPGALDDLADRLGARVVAATGTTVSLEVVGSPAALDDAVARLAVVAAVHVQRSGALRVPVGPGPRAEPGAGPGAGSGAEPTAEPRRPGGRHTGDAR